MGSYQGGFSGSNLYVEWDDPNSAFSYDTIFTNASAGFGVTLEDLRPVAGGPADFGSGLGAEARLYELLEGGGSVSKPVAGDDAVSLDEDTSATFDVLSNDSDPEGGALTLSDVGTPSHGTVTVNANGTLTYTPDADFSGTDSFTYTVRNAAGGTDTGRVSVTVTPTEDDAPVAMDDTYSVLQGGEIVIDLLANDYDPDGTAITFVGINEAGGAKAAGTADLAQGTLTDLGNGKFSYRADAGATGSESFTYTIRDASGATDTATVTLNIGEQGAIPSPVFTAFAAGSAGSAETVVKAHSAAYELAEGTLELGFTANTLSGRQGLFSKDSSYYDNGGHLTVLLEGDDVLVRLQSKSATYEIRATNAITAGQEHHVALTFGPGGMELYVDGELAGTNPYTGGLQGNAEPIVIGANQWASGDNAADVIQDDFSGTVTVAKLYGEALDADQVQYLSEFGGDPDPAPNTAPDATSDSASTDEGVAVKIDVLANDADAQSDALSVSSVGTAANGTVTINADGTLTYTPKAGFSGTDSFTYTVTDGALTDTATVTVKVDPAADPDPGTGTVTVSNAAQLLAALDSAAAGDTIVLKDGDYGAVALNGLNFSGEVTIVAENPLGAVFDSIEVIGSSYLTIDGVHVDHPSDGERFTGIVDISGSSHHVKLVNSEINGLVDGSYDGAYGIRVFSGTSFIDIVDNYVHDVRHGAFFFDTSDLTVSGNIFNYVGEDSMKFASIQGALIENNDGASVYRLVDTAVHPDFIQFQGSGEDITIRGNTLFLAESTWNFAVQGIFLGKGTFQDFLIEDNLIYTNTVNGIYARSDPGTGGNITIRQNTVLSSPDTTVWGDADIRIVSVAGDYLVENNIVDRVVDNVGTGTVRNNLQLQWEDPNAPNYYGDVYANATAGSSATIEDFLPVAGGPGDFGSGMGAEELIQELTGGTPADPNADPDAADDALSIGFGESVAIDVLANDSDPDGDALTVTAATADSGGSVSINADGTLSYTPASGFSGQEAISYTISDGRGGSATATVTIDVEAAPNAAPVAVDDTVSVDAGESVAIDVLANDSDPGGDALTVTAATAAKGGSVSINADGTLSYTPASGFSGQEAISYTVSDGKGGTATATVMVTVAPPAGGGTVLPTPILAEGGHVFGGTAGDAVVLPHSSSYLLSEGTIALSFTADTLAARQGLLSKDAYGYGGGGHVGILLEGDTLVVRLQSQTSTNEIRVPGIVEAGVEHHVALTFGSGGMEVYVDGISVATRSYSGGLSGNREPIVIGANQWGSSAQSADEIVDPFDGTISGVALYGEALSGEQVFALAGGETGEAPGDTAHIIGSEAPEQLAGDAGDNLIEGLGGNDVLAGKDGDDVLRGGLGADSLDGGAGFDTADYSDATGGIEIGLYRTGKGSTAAGDTMTGIERIVGSNFGDMLIGGGVSALTLDGGAGNDTLYDYGASSMLIGGEGYDILVGGGGDDALYGGAHNDWLFGGDGADLIDGGDGVDWLSYNGAAGGVSVDLGAGTGTAGEAAGDQITGIENLYGSAGDDTLTGDAGFNQIVGGAGADTIDGGGGNDYLSGGAGADLFVYGELGWGRDLIFDFEDGVDMIDLRGSGLTFASFKEVATPQGVRLDLEDGTAIHIFNVSVNQIDENDFLI